MAVILKLVLALVQGRLSPIIWRRLLRLASRYISLPFEFRVQTGTLERPAHGYCLWGAVKLAERLGYERISVAEFGVAGGNTLRFIADYAKELERSSGIKIEVYGFDTGEGLPDLEGPADLPYWFYPQQYPMDIEKLKAKCPEAELVIGNVAETVVGFFEDGYRAPLAAIFIDLDFYSSTRDVLKIFDSDKSHFLPRLFVYLDDVVGSDLEMYGPFNGEIAAVEEFNNKQDSIKIHLNRNLLPRQHVSYRYNIYYAHIFDHTKYADYVGGVEQELLSKNLRLS